jgi:hypothetical protein
VLDEPLVAEGEREQRRGQPQDVVQDAPLSVRPALGAVREQRGPFGRQDVPDPHPVRDGAPVAEDSTYAQRWPVAEHPRHHERGAE